MSDEHLDALLTGATMDNGNILWVKHLQDVWVTDLLRNVLQHGFCGSSAFTALTSSNSCRLSESIMKTPAVE